MKYSIEQKQAIKDGHILNFIVKPKIDREQIKLQEIINSHYPEPEKYETYESSINQ